MSEYMPSPQKYVVDQVELYERTGGVEGSTMQGLPVVIVTHRGATTGAIRKTPLMTVLDGDSYVLVASMGGAPKHPLWYHNFIADPNVEIRDGANVYSMKVREVTDSQERQRLWAIAIEAYPPYQDYQNKTERVIPLFIAEKQR